MLGMVLGSTAGALLCATLDIDDELLGAGMLETELLDTGALEAELLETELLETELGAELTLDELGVTLALDWVAEELVAGVVLATQALSKAAVGNKTNPLAEARSHFCITFGLAVIGCPLMRKLGCFSCIIVVLFMNKP